MKKLIALIMTVLLVGTLVGCSSSEYVASESSVKQESAYQEQLMKQAIGEVGSPEITEFFEKKMAKEIFELRDNSNLITYAYTVNLDGKYVYLGKCMGFGLPYSVQYTNPEVMKTVDGGEYGALNPYTLPQADPNGLYMPEGLSATWLMLINEDTGNREIIYAEPEIVVTQSKLPKRLCAEWSIPENY